MRIAALALILVATGGGAALAQPGGAGPLSGLTNCRAIADPAARVACYDKAVDALTAATERKEVVVMDRAAVRETKKGLFGFNIGRLPFFGDGKDEPEDKESLELATTITSVRPVAHGKYRFVITDGAIWETTEAATFFSPEKGEQVILQRGALGAYYAKLGPRARRVAAKRLN